LTPVSCRFTRPATSIAFNLSSKQLRRAANLRERIDKLEKQLAAILTPASEAPVKVAAEPVKPPKRKRKMSKAARAKQAERMKKRWAKVKAAGKKSL
jgi:hypothetical protein